jgi:Ca2+-binding EF-hand superfamily protein
MVKEVDADGNGEIDFGEFSIMMQNLINDKE